MSTYLFESLKTPARLYIKQCPHCGLKYFGMTWDVKFERHGCDDLWFFTKNIGVVPIPTGACNDRLALHFLASCGDTSCAGLSAIL